MNLPTSEIRPLPIVLSLFISFTMDISVTLTASALVSSVSADVILPSKLPGCPRTVSTVQGSTGPANVAPRGSQGPYAGYDDSAGLAISQVAPGNLALHAFDLENLLREPTQGLRSEIRGGWLRTFFLFTP